MAVSSNPQGTQKKDAGTMGRAVQDAKDTAHNLSEQARSGAAHLADKARDAASNAADKARDTASNVADKARDTASHLGDRAEDAITSVGDTMTSLAGTIRQNAPHGGMVGNAASTMADNLQAGGRYLQEHGLDDMGADLTRLVRSYPLQALLVGFGVGCLMGMSLRR